MESARSRFQMSHPWCVQSIAASGASRSRGCPRILQEFLEHGVRLITIHRELLDHLTRRFHGSPPALPLGNELPLGRGGPLGLPLTPVNPAMDHQPKLPHELLRG